MISPFCCGVIVTCIFCLTGEPRPVVVHAIELDVIFAPVARISAARLLAKLTTGRDALLKYSTSSHASVFCKVVPSFTISTVTVTADPTVLFQMEMSGDRSGNAKCGTLARDVIFQDSGVVP